MTVEDRAKRREYEREYRARKRAENPEAYLKKQRERARKWRAKSVQHCREYDKARRPREREKRRVSARQYYLVRSQERRGWLRETEGFLGCFVCGDSDYRHLVWHHLTPVRRKGRRLSEIAVSSGVEAAMEEMKRCVLLCANCHMDVHHDMQIWPDSTL